MYYNNKHYHKYTRQKFTPWQLVPSYHRINKMFSNCIGLKHVHIAIKTGGIIMVLYLTMVNGGLTKPFLGVEYDFRVLNMIFRWALRKMCGMRLKILHNLFPATHSGVCACGSTLQCGVHMHLPQNAL